MIDVTVKTLDSQNHRYSVPDEITVKQFKDRIASSVSIPPDKQRLIYCGRVLQDDKSLSEYGVHEKVIHLVMRAPPQTARNRSSSQSSSANQGEFQHRVRGGGGGGGGGAATRGPSSSGVRLQQAKTMLDKASSTLDQLEALFPSTSINERPSASRDSGSSEPMEDSPPEAGPSTSSGTEEASSTSQPTVKKDVPPSTLTEHANVSSEELQNLFTEMDVLNNSYTYNSMDSPMMTGGSNMGMISTSLAGGLAQAASAAFASALSSMNVAPGESEPSRSSAPSTPRASRRTTASNANSGTGASTPSTPSRQPTTTTTTPPSTSQPQSNVRGITVRITNRGQRTPSVRLEHPRSSVMVQVFDRYQDVNRRLQPFLHHYYTIMATEPTYENEDDPRMRSDQFVIWRVSAAMHFLSHAMHAISDIIIDLRRNPPRQLRARPIIIPQPAIVQAQINLSTSSDGGVPSRSADRSSANTSNPTTSGTSTSSTAQRQTSTSTRTATSNPQMPNLPRNLLDLDDGVVVMHVGPSGFSIDSLTGEGSGEGNPPPELLQNLMSTLTSQLEMNLGAPASSSSASSSPPATPGGVRNAAPVHNSQAGGNSGTNTTNATHTRVTPRPQVHVTPLHVPGMGMTQFDPFLPCSSHHIRQFGRRRHQATRQGTQPSSTAPQAQSSTADPVPSSSASTESTPRGGSESNPDHYAAFLNDLTALSRQEGTSEGSAEDQQDNLFLQLIQGVVSDILTPTGGSSSEGTTRERVSLHEFLEPIVGANNLVPTDRERDSFFFRLFEVISQSLSLQDLVQLFCGASQRLDQLREPLIEFVNTHVLNGLEPSERNVSRGVDAVVNDLNPHITASFNDADVDEGIDYTLTMQNFARRHTQILFSSILNSEDSSTFGASLHQLLNRTYQEFIALGVLILKDGVTGFERLVESRMTAIMSDLTPTMRSLSVSITLRHIRSVLAHLTVSEDQVQRYVVAPGATGQLQDERVDQLSTSETSSKPQDDDSSSNENYVEAMDVDDIGCVEEVATSEVSVAPEESPLTVTVGSRPWHSAVPQDWIPVITRDVERQRNGRPDTNLSDGYLCGMPLKRRKIASQNKPHGAVCQVMQDNLRQSLRSSGVNRTVIDSVAGAVSTELSDSFASHVRSTLRGQLQGNQDFRPEKFPKSEQKIRKKQ